MAAGVSPVTLGTCGALAVVCMAQTRSLAWRVPAMPCAARFPPGPLEALVRLPACRSWGGGWGQWLAEGEWPCGLELEDRPPSPARWRAECVWAQDSMALLSETGNRRGLLLHCAPGEEGGWPPGRFRWHSEARGSSIQTRFLVSRGGGTGGAGSPCPASARGGRFCSRCPLAQVPGCRAAPQGPPRAAARVPCCCRGQAACPARSHAVWGVLPAAGTEWQPRGPRELVPRAELDPQRPPQACRCSRFSQGP